MEDGQVSNSFLVGRKQNKASFDTKKKHMLQDTV